MKKSATIGVIQGYYHRGITFYTPYNLVGSGFFVLLNDRNLQNHNLLCVFVIMLNDAISLVS